MAMQKILCRISAVLFLVGLLLCLFSPYLEYSRITGSLFSSKIVKDSMSCIDLLYNGNKFGINNMIVSLFWFAIIIKIVGIIAMAISKLKKGGMIVFIATETFFFLLHLYLMAGMDDVKKRFSGYLGLIMDAAGIKYSYGFYLNMVVSVIVIGILLLAIYFNKSFNKETNYKNNAANVKK